MGWTSQFDDQVSLVLPGTPDRVWAVVADLGRIGEWSPECTGISWLPPFEGPELGARFVGRNRMGPIGWRTTCTIVEWEPGLRLAYDALHATGAVTRWTFALVEREGGTLVTQGFQTLGSPRLIMLADRIARRPSRLRDAMTTTLEAMRSSLG